MLLETTLLISVASGTVPTVFWGQEWARRRTMELEYNIRIAQSLGHAATLRDHETGAHNFRVTYLASLFGESCGLNKKEIRSLMKGAFLHDVGKIGIPDKILLKQAALDQDEWAVMREHPVMGEKLLADMPWFQDAIPVVLHHHERYDGSGYPAGLTGEAIPVMARIFAVIDVFDALLAARSYKTAFALPQTLGILEKESGSHFDPEIIERFMQLAPNLAEQVVERTEPELKVLLEERRREIFGV
ncbi:hypothetical protein SKTS_22450 [Sulfurimicrobium lacus]|uniref:HD-GYP domain-containing protein n=1 Tax=Sulfurimicrobium lacus TaxID=2715678 RepID=A0A6F8VF62_9PROT|nr:HD domain-containing phosphohydrolase [Sulfurimicrobium lacus]BCB27359.1 hypothetical protein SKTS_22450 [Sulfurimicrobium lacus]